MTAISVAAKKAVVAALFLMGFTFGAALAQDFPNKPVRMINPWPAGGAGDAVLRPIAQRLGEALGQPVVVENRVGNNGVIGSAIVAKAPPDGYTVLFSHVGPTAISPALQANMPYDSVKDFAPITQITSSPLILVCRPGMPVTTIRELIDHARANPGKLNYGSFGNGSTGHLAGEMLKVMGHVNMLHVPYKGGAPLLVDILGDRIDCVFFNIASVVPQVRSGRLRGIAVTTLKRSALVPEYPTVHESLPGFEVNSWFGFMAPAGTPKEIVSRLYTELAKIVRSPEISEQLKQNGLDLEVSTPEEYSRQIRSDLARWAKLIKETGIKAD